MFDESPIPLFASHLNDLGKDLPYRNDENNYLVGGMENNILYENGENNYLVDGLRNDLLYEQGDIIRLHRQGKNDFLTGEDDTDSFITNIGNSYSNILSHNTLTADDYSSNTGTSGRLSIGGSRTGNIETTGDHDWFKVTLTAGHEYQFDLEGSPTAGGTLSDTYLRLRNSSGSVISTNDDGGTGLNSQISYTATSSGTYFLDAAAFSSSYGTGTYTVSAEQSGSSSDDYSSNTGTSGRLSIGGSRTGNIETTGDHDWFKVTLTAGHEYQFDLEGSPTAGGTLSDTYLRLRNSSGSVISTNDDGGTGRNSQITYTATTSGTYFLDAAAYSSYYGTGTYTVSAQRDSADDYGSDTGTNGRLSIGGSRTGNIETNGDHDWFKVTLTAGTSYQFDMEGSGNAALADSYLYLRDSSGDLLTRDDDSGPGFGSLITYTATTSGTYFLDAASYTGTGTYTVSAEQSGSSADDYSSNTGTSGRLSIGGSRTGNIETNGDHDWFAVSLTAGMRYQFDLEGSPTAGGTLSDPILRLRNSSGSLISTNDDGGTGLNSQISYTATTSGTYYLDAYAYTSNTGTYTVSARQDGDDYRANTNTSGAVSIGSSSTGNIETTGDHDWFKITLTADHQYQFDLEGSPTAGGTLSDPILRLRNSSGSLISTNDDGGTGLNSQISYTATTSGTYYLDAYAYTSNTGTYTVSAEDKGGDNPTDGWSVADGWGQASAERAFESLLGINLQSQPDDGGNLWGLDAVGAQEVWAETGSFSGVTGSGVTVAVVDTGIDYSHREFAGRIVGGWDFVDNDSRAQDGHGHGTHCAGTIAGANDGVGITGVAYNARIMPIRVLDDDGSGSTADVTAGIRYAADNGADVISLSLGGGAYNQEAYEAVRYATQQGCVVVMASGNDGAPIPGYPAYYARSYGIAVGAVDINGTRASFSNDAGTGEYDYVTAPGVNIYSARNGGGYTSMSGTSMATPHVAGIAALLKSYDNDLSAARIEQLLSTTGSNV